jgi:hypothetical protein
VPEDLFEALRLAGREARQRGQHHADRGSSGKAGRRICNSDPRAGQCPARRRPMPGRSLKPAAVKASTVTLATSEMPPCYRSPTTLPSISDSATHMEAWAAGCAHNAVRRRRSTSVRRRRCRPECLQVVQVQ